MVLIRPFDPDLDGAWAEGLLEVEFGGRMQARRGELVDALEGEGLVAEEAGEPLGLVTWLLGPDASAEIRVVVVADGVRGRGIGSDLLEAALATARESGARAAWLVTTNDATDALAFYQHHGLRLVALRAGAVDEARASLKPTIGLTGARGIPLRDELDLWIDLRPADQGT